MLRRTSALVVALAQLTGAVATMKLRSGLKMTASGGSKLRMPQPATLATSAALVSTGAVFVRSKMTQTAVTAVANPKMAEGLAYSFAALCGNTAASLLRTQVSRSSKVKLAEQVGLATALQGVVACAYCAQQGLFSTAVTSAFLIPAVGSAVLNALTKTLETKAYAITDVSLCAPFLAFDPVMQFLLPALFAPLACRFMGIGCGFMVEFPPYHPLAVVCVGTGAYLLASVAAKAAAKAKKSDSKVDARTAYGLPIGAWMILGNCAIYSITSRLDKLAVLAAGKTLYYAYGRVIMASTCFLGVRPGKEAVKELTQPKVASLVLMTCAAEAVYMLALYQAFACISPVYVTAIKRGGGVLLASFASMFFFKEPLAGRGFPIAAIVAGVVALCL
jgi:multidrug transporter EmrE-like cation transporter